MNGYLIPANAKRGTLILNIFRPFDLWLFGIGVGISLFLMAIFDPTNINMVLLALAPGCICGLLVVPIPNYHNILCVLCSIYRFYTSQRNYKWKGWCFYGKFPEEESGK